MVCVNLARLPSDSSSHPYYKRELEYAKNQLSNLAFESFRCSHQFGNRVGMTMGRIQVVPKNIRSLTHFVTW